MPVGVTLQRLHRNPGAQIHPGVTLHLGGDVTDHPAQSPDQRRVGALGDRHR
jgi:hypothetical protein